MRLSGADAPPRTAFTRRERRVIDRLRTPAAVQRFLNDLPYNTEPPPGRATLRSFRQVLEHQTVHCLEAALTAAVILEQHGYPPLVLSFESIDELDHVLFVYRSRGRWGSIGRSRDPGLHGRKPVFASRARAGVELRRSLRGLHGSRDRVRGGGSEDAAGRLRLATFREERLEGGASAPRPSPSHDPQLGSPNRCATSALPPLPGGTRPQTVRVLPRSGEVDGVAAGVSESVTTSNSQPPTPKVLQFGSWELAVGSSVSQSRSKSRVGFVMGSSRA